MRKNARKTSNFVQILCRMIRTRQLFLILFAIFSLSSCVSDTYVDFSGYAQGGVYNVKANLKGVKVQRKVIASVIDSLLTGIDFSLSGYNGNSLLSRYNAGEQIQPDRFFTEVMELSDSFNESTGGVFDVKSAPLFEIWGFGFKSGSFPTQEMIDSAMLVCKSGKILNFNAIAQGYTCDVIASYLHSIGVRDMLVDIGEIYCEGVNAKGLGWSIGVDNPVDGNNTPGADINGIWQSDGGSHGVVTSGNYRKFYVKDGKKYAHTIDPRTGRPVEHDLLSATVIAPTAAEADAIATACMVLGPEEGRRLIENDERLEAYFITSEGVWSSPGFFIYL